MKEEAGEEMSKLAFILNEEDRGKYILTTVLSMAHDDNVEENRIVAVQVLFFLFFF
jgi:serine/threonine-protein phosphatase 4 regulatory subunit 1